jgi:glyoxylase-like metal-dependent hydrolase (beta-lactamase superfamily II)
MTDPFDCHVYLLDGDDELALVDCGAGMGLDRILENVRADGFDPRQIRHLLLTHAHGDHAGGASRARSTLSLQVIAAAEAAAWLRAGDERAISLDLARHAGIYPDDYHLNPCPVDVEVREGDAIAVGDLDVRVYDTPGHSRGHCSYLFSDGNRSCLFAGDAVFFGGRILLQATWDCSVQESVATVRKLSELRLDVLLAGHASLVLSDAQRHLDLAMGWVNRLLPPPQLQT